MAHLFLDRLALGPIVADGAMGTMLHARGIAYDRSFDELNASQPDLVQQIHREYISVGAEIIQTNTFGANRIRLATYGLENRARDLNRRGASIAREAREIAGESVFVAGSIGPVGVPLQPVGSLSLYDVRIAFREQVEALVEKGVDLLLLETFSDLAEITEAILAIRETTDLPVVAQMTFTEDGYLASGATPAEVVKVLERLKPDVIGVNCGVGPQSSLDIVRAMSAVTAIPLSVQPNAGLPARLGGRLIYVSTPEYLGSIASLFIEAGARIVGGCCGTTPEHIRAMHTRLTDRLPETQKVAPVEVIVARTAPIEISHSPNENTLRAKLRRGEFIVSVELDPPRGLNPRKALEGAAILKEMGADCINIGDSPMATVRMSSIGLALLIQRQVQLETIIHYTPRDRNLMALQSDLLGAYANGIRNVIAVTGDPPRAGGTHPGPTGVWDVDSIGLIAILKRFNQGIDFAGKSIGKQAEFTVACAVTPVADDLNRELDRLRQKIEAGADFVMSQPLWSMGQLLEFETRSGILPIPHVLGILPLESFKHAELLHNEVPGMVVPPEVRERMRRAGEHGREEGLLLAREFIEEARSRVAGVYLITSYGRYDTAIELTRHLKSRSDSSVAAFGVEVS